MIETDIRWNDILFMLQGAWMSLAITFLAVVGGTILGTIFGLIRASAFRIANILLGATLDVFRSVPLLIQLILANSFKSIIGLNWSAFTISSVILAIYTSAYCAEIVRAGVLSVAPVTRRAARSLGMTYWQDLNYVVLPMAARIALPGWTGLVLAVVKDSSLVMWIGIVELLRASQIVVVRTHEPMLVLLLTGLIYFLICFPISRLSAWLESRWSAHD